MSFDIAELNSRLSCLMSIVSLINQIESHEEAVQSIRQRIESLVEHISHDLLLQLRNVLERSRASPQTVIYCNSSIWRSLLFFLCQRAVTGPVKVS